MKLNRQSHHLRRFINLFPFSCREINHITIIINDVYLQKFNRQLEYHNHH